MSTQWQLWSRLKEGWSIMNVLLQGDRILCHKKDDIQMYRYVCTVGVQYRDVIAVVHCLIWYWWRCICVMTSSRTVLLYRKLCIRWEASWEWFHKVECLNCQLLVFNYFHRFQSNQVWMLIPNMIEFISNCVGQSWMNVGNVFCGLSKLSSTVEGLVGISDVVYSIWMILEEYSSWTICV